MRTARTGLAALLVALAAALPAGCGFRPLYGDTTAGNARTLAQIEIMQIADRRGQILRNMLLDRLTPTGQPRQPAYALGISLDESRQELAIRRDESATRANLTITAHFMLRALRDPRLGVFSGTARSTNSFNVLRSEFATLSAENSARERGLRALSEEIRIRVAAALQNPPAFFTPASPAAPAPAR